jgi:hypothetical protein
MRRIEKQLCRNKKLEWMNQELWEIEQLFFFKKKNLKKKLMKLAKNFTLTELCKG